MHFLRYIREWGKKVVFVLNKVDILASDSEVDEARLTRNPRSPECKRGPGHQLAGQGSSRAGRPTSMSTKAC